MDMDIDSTYRHIVISLRSGKTADAPGGGGVRTTGPSTKMDSSKRQALAAVLLDEMQGEKSQKKLRFWVHDILKKRKQHGEFHHLFSELCLDDECFRS